MPFDRLPLFDYTEKRDIYEPGGINGGQTTIFDWLSAEGIPTHRTNWRLSERSAIDALAADLQAGRPRFVYLYLAGLDGILHAHGTSSPLVDAHLAFYERELRSLLQLARRQYGDVRLHVFSDHGMTDVTSTCNLIARVEAAGLRFGVDYAAAYDSTMARFWFLAPGARETITRVLRDEPAGRVLDDDELEALGCDFPDRRFGELFFLLDAGVLLCPSFLGLTPLKGMHGYHPSEPTARAVFASSAPDVVAPNGLTDLHGFFQREATFAMQGARRVAA
jgi:predicted AlkP superfamily pyrophosphatase or phosphodiesterase